MTSTGIITNIQRCSTEDGPGIRTTVFFKGCPMSCIWCHNIETIDQAPRVVWYAIKCIGDQACVRACPESALELTQEGIKIDHEKCKTCGTCEEECPTGAIKIMGTIRSSDELVEELIRDAIFFATSNGGVTLSGGEATFQSTFAIDIAKGLHDHGIHVALDTCGYCSEIVLQDILPHVDLVLYDLKVMNPKKHEEYTGVPITRVIENAKILGRTGKPVWIRTPIIPGYTDDEENIRAIAKFIVTTMPNVERFDLLAFNRMCTEKYALFDLEYPLKDTELITEEVMERLASIARSEGLTRVEWSGMTKETRTIKNDKKLEVKPCGC
ncbi:glycyl-radical enzyme activating protein [Candidatus Thorarchaeota archaeon]|nr:MAG: glycyl-radical enzyme activating protein [Candidatus Thorarchaeota archaeon]